MTVTRPARLTGAALCAALALVTTVWVLEDLAALGSPAALARYWTGDAPALLRGRPATSPLDPALLAVSAATAVAALRARHAAAALAATGGVTLALRLPGLWAPGNEALVTTLLDLALATGLVAVALTGRPADTPYAPLPTRPRTAAAVTAGLLLLAAGLATVLRELYRAVELPPEATVDRFTGGRSVIGPVFAPPPGWLSAVLAALYATAAVSALARARHSRPLGLLAGVLLAAGGLGGTVRAVRYGTLAHLADLPAAHRADVLASVLGLLAGLAVLVLLAGRGVPDAPGPRPRAGTPHPAPPRPPPPGW
ncbi:hypothetical protein [Streptomyces sp. NPDC001744]|uniref:hypothetical protein n=1 Tax=Streptomyces sp. NPDC001744 TaxID=3364606 RepID=UPI0036BB43EE